MLPKSRPPTHPGEIPLQRVNSIVNGKRGVTPETAILLARFFETTAEFWMNLQTQYDLWFAERALSKA
jgi:addiction module HigA family antidote